MAGRCELGRLGVGDPGFLTRPSKPGRLSVISCSLMVPVKRVDLIREAIETAARRRPDLHIVWNHIGDGPLRREVEAAARSLPLNARVTFHGQLTAGDMLAVYRRTPIDVFVNVSTYEGTPVSLMEAASCGMPIVATAVGGNPEVVSDSNGRLLPADPSASQVADALLAVATELNADALRTGSRRTWRERYYNETNFQQFASRLRSFLVDSVS
jgi:glycosyltransferase involved in cell wall biosynthesis